MKRFSSQSGFTLAETLIGFTIIVAAITATTALVVSSIRGNALNRERLIAYHLASEGLEIMRNVRDSNWLQNQGWRSGDPAERGVSWDENGRYLVDRDENYLSTGEGIPFSVMRFDEKNDRSCLFKVSFQGGARYRHAACLPERTEAFRRVLFVDDPAATIRSEVTWQDRGTQHVVSLTTRLTDWKPSPL